MTTSLIATCFITSVFIVIFTICDVTLRLCQTLISLTDINQQFEESILSILKSHFALNVMSAIIIISVLLFLNLMVTIQGCPLNYVWDFGPYVCITSMIFSFFLSKMTSLAKWERTESGLKDRKTEFALDDMKGLDYGTGLAYNFYYGYLRVILPSTGTASKGIVEKIENFEDNHNVTFPVHKLFILIPSSAYIPPNLKEVSYKWMENVHELEEEKRSRAGNVDRTYRNNVYKIYPDGRNSGADPIYVVVEGATPLLTFYEVQNHTHPESAIYKQYKKEIVITFYKKLHEILQNEPDTKDLCELICYDDYNSSGNKVNVAKIILERISEIKDSSYI